MATTLTNWPTLTVEIAFATDPLATPTYTDVSAYVRGLAIRRGRNHELDRIEAGTLRLTLNNRDRRFDPANASSPYYPNVIPMRRIRVSATWDSNTYRLFTGFIQDWPMSWQGVKDAEVDLSAVDGFAVLARAEILNANWPAEASGARVARVLTEIGWPAGERTLDTGQSDVVALDNTSNGQHVNALQHIQDVVTTERGIFFMDGQGYATFHDRHRRLKSPYLTSQATFGDNGTTELPYVDLRMSYEVDEVRNDVHVKASGSSTTQVADDATSISKYLIRTYNLDTLLTSDSQASDLATFLLAKYKDPFLRVNQMTLNGRMSGDVLEQALSRELGDKITVVRRPPGGGSAITQPSHIEFATHDVRKGGNSWTWRTQWSLSPAEQNAFWTLGDSTLSVLGTTTRIAY